MGFLDGITGGLGSLAGGIGGIVGGLPVVGGIAQGLPFVGGMFGGGQAQQAGGAQQYPQGYGGAQSPSPWPQMPGGAPQGAPGAGRSFDGKLNVPGAAESFFAQNKDKWTTGPEWGPGVSGQYWNGVAGRGNTAPPKNSNYAADAYNHFGSTAPQDTSSFYDNAERKAGENINAAYAARGMGRSSGALDQLAEASTNIRAQQAKDDADYALKRGTLEGNLASSADASGYRGNQGDLSWITGLGNLGLGVDSSQLSRLMGMDSAGMNRLNSGMTASIGAENALRQRGQDYFGNTLSMSNAEANPMLGIYLQMLSKDQELQQNAIDASLGGSREALNQSVTGRANTEQGIGNLLNLGAGISKSGGLGGIAGGIL